MRLEQWFTQGESIVPMTHEMEGRFHSYLFVAVYERLESNLNALYGRTPYVDLAGQVTLKSKCDSATDSPVVQGAKHASLLRCLC